MEVDPQPIPQFLDDQRDNHTPEELLHFFLSFQDFWERRLWHQLTIALVAFFDDPKSGPQRLPIFKTFVSNFADKINQLQYVSLALAAAGEFKDHKEAATFLEGVVKKVKAKPDDQEAYVYANVELAQLKLFLDDKDTARKLLDESEKILERFDSVESIVHASFYRVNADYYNKIIEFAQYYRNALLYLACIDTAEDLTAPEQQHLAYNLAIAALLSDEIYNFGELLLHPILNSLIKSEHAWLRDLLFAFNAGDLSKYNTLQGNFAKQPFLDNAKVFLREKICLSALTEAVFRRPPHDRAMSFQMILKETGVFPEEVEHMLMKALSLGLLKGSMDQVAEVARISWVQPKVLDKTQIKNMRQRLLDWDVNVAGLTEYMSERLAAPIEA